VLKVVSVSFAGASLEAAVWWNVPESVL